MSTESTEQYRADFEAWARDNGHPIRFNADGSYAGMNSYRFEGYAGARREAGAEQQDGAALVDDYLLLGYATNSSVATLRERMSVGADGLTTSIRARPYNKCTVAIYALVSQQVSAAIGTPAKREASTEPSALTDDAKDAAHWRDLLASVITEMPQRLKSRDGNAPGHGHDKPGVWDSDNGALAGKECAWCKVWNSAVAAIEAKAGSGT